VECQVFIHKTTGVRKMKTIDYTTPQDGQNNVVLIVEGKKLHLSKDYLAVHSPVFSAMFYGDFAEKNQAKIELKEVKYEEFVDFLNVIYPTSIEITASTVAHILQLADIYQVKCAIDRAESYLIATKKCEPLDKLAFADRYRLDLLMQLIMRFL
ncbi:hypothetical protein PFISCL1PPCAC_21369, partial [Pristionchus fissidentatus]